MNNPPPTSSPPHPHPPRLQNRRRLWVVLVAVVVGLCVLLVVCAVFAALMGLRAENYPGAGWVVGLMILIPLALVLLLTVLVVVAVRRVVRRKIQEAQDWPSTRGVVLTSEVRDMGGDGGWQTDVVYRYEVGGRVYENSRIAVAVEFGGQSLEAHQRLAARFPAGARVTVYYNPQNPADAALIKGDPNSWAPSRF